MARLRHRKWQPAFALVGEWVIDRVLRFMIFTALQLPLEPRLRLIGGFARRVASPIGGYKKRARANLDLVWPELPVRRKEDIAAASLENFGRAFIEGYDINGMKRQVGSVTGEGLKALEAARRDSRPVVCVSGHYGHPEMPRRALLDRGHDIGFIYRPIHNRFFAEHYDTALKQLGGEMFPHTPEGNRSFVRYLARGGMVMLMVDIAFFEGERFDFLGHPAMTSTAAAGMALRFNALVVPTFATRRPDGVTFDIEFEAPIGHSDERTMTIETNRRLEARITAQPEQWFWVHRRWKMPRLPQHKRSRSA
jgi:KDO2-lipid IV(A) lauroyltransferase